MPERDFIVEKKRITYEGIFSFAKLYQLIDQYFENLGYDKVEQKNVEVVQPEGKYVEVEMEPYKSIADWAKQRIHLRIICSNLKEVDIKRDGKTERLSQGKVQIVIDAWLETDTMTMWEEKPIYYILRQIFHKYAFPPATRHFKANIAGDVGRMVDEVKAFLNLYKF